MVGVCYLPDRVVQDPLLESTQFKATCQVHWVHKSCRQKISEEREIDKKKYDWFDTLPDVSIDLSKMFLSNYARTSIQMVQ